MAPKDELDYLKSLVAQLNNKIDQLELKAKDKLSGAAAAVGAATGLAQTPAQQLRTILIGPPGAGTRLSPLSFRMRVLTARRQARARRPRRFATSTACATLRRAGQ
jgi:hypothetical protein